MNLNTEPIKEWFGFSRRERRSNFTLLIIIIVIIGMKYAIPEKAIKIEDLSGTIRLAEMDNNEAVNDSSSYTKRTSYPGNGSNSYKYPVKKLSAGPGNLHPTTPKNTFQQSDKYRSRKKPLVEINSSDTAALATLPGIGPVLSLRIVKYRNLLGGYINADQLKEVYGLSEETFAMIKDRISIDTALVKKVNINSAGYKELSHIHYLEKYDITSILKYRDLKGKINNVNELIDNKIITKEKGERVRGYLGFEP